MVRVRVALATHNARATSSPQVVPLSVANSLLADELPVATGNTLPDEYEVRVCTAFGSGRWCLQRVTDFTI